MIPLNSILNSFMKFEDESFFPSQVLIFASQSKEMKWCGRRKGEGTDEKESLVSGSCSISFETLISKYIISIGQSIITYIWSRPCALDRLGFRTLPKCQGRLPAKGSLSRTLTFWHLQLRWEYNIKQFDKSGLYDVTRVTKYLSKVNAN